MKFIEQVQSLDSVVNEYGTRMLSKHIDDGVNNIKPLDNVYHNTIFNSMLIPGHAILYKIFNNVAVWLIEDFSDDLYLESIDDYLKTNTSEHGKLVYESFLKNKEYFQDDYFGEERKRITNTQGLLFIITERNEKNEIVKTCYFHPVTF